MESRIITTLTDALDTITEVDIDFIEVTECNNGKYVDRTFYDIEDVAEHYSDKMHDMCSYLLTTDDDGIRQRKGVYIEIDM